MSAIEMGEHDMPLEVGMLMDLPYAKADKAASSELAGKNPPLKR